MLKILVLSSHTSPATNAAINHRLYCKKHNYNYLFDVTPYENTGRYDQKINSILSNVVKSDWLLWVDDDVYFMNDNIKIEDFIPDNPNIDIVICDSPRNEKGEWTVINSGVMLIRNTEFSRNAFEKIKEISLSEVKRWWNEDEHGMFTSGDQDTIFYYLKTGNYIESKVKIIPHTLMNSRVYHFVNKATDGFICHLAGVEDKKVAVRQIAKRFDLSPCLTDKIHYEGIKKFYANSMFSDDRFKLSFKNRVRKVLKKIRQFSQDKT